MSIAFGSIGGIRVICVQADLGAGFVEGVLIALFTIAKNAGRVMVSIFTFVSVRGSLFCVHFIEAPSNSFSVPIIVHHGTTTTCSQGIIARANWWGWVGARRSLFFNRFRHSAISVHFLS